MRTAFLLPAGATMLQPRISADLEKIAEWTRALRVALADPNLPPRGLPVGRRGTVQHYPLADRQPPASLTNSVEFLRRPWRKRLSPTGAVRTTADDVVVIHRWQKARRVGHPGVWVSQGWGTRQKGSRGGGDASFIGVLRLRAQALRSG